jgi:hypothetical protein
MNCQRTSKVLFSDIYWQDQISFYKDQLTDFRSSKNQPLSLKEAETQTRNSIREFGEWNREMVKLLRKLITKLEGTVEAWERFVRKDIGYFLFDNDGVPSAPSFLECSVNAVDNIFLDLKDILRKFKHLEEELCKDNPLLGVSYSLY